MSENESESTEENASTEAVGISDDQLPDDLQPTDENPLAQELDPDERPDDLMEGGKDADEMEDKSADSDSDSESGDEDDTEA